MIRTYLFQRVPGGPSEASGGGTAVLVGVATQEQIDGWKKEFKAGIYSVTVDGHIAYFQNPNRMHMNIAMSKASTDAALDMYEKLAQLTKIGGSEDLLTDDAMFFGLTQQLKSKMDGKKAALVNL